MINRQIRKLANEYMTLAHRANSQALQHDSSANHTLMTFEAALELARATLRTVETIAGDPFPASHGGA